MPARRPLFSILACLLTLLLVGGTALPAPALWQCHHSARIVNAAFAAPPSAMPCRMGGGQMPPMACCPPVRRTAKQTLGRPACQPTLTRLATLPAFRHSDQTRLRLSLASTQAALPLPVALLRSVPTALPCRQRPPPTLSLPPSVPLRSPGPRAPPVA